MILAKKLHLQIELAYYLDEEFISLEEAFKNFLETSEDFNLIKHLNDDDEILQVYEADNEPIYFPLNKDYEYLLNGINGDEGNLNLNYDDAINEKKLVAGDGFEPPTFGL